MLETKKLSFFHIFLYFLIFHLEFADLLENCRHIFNIF